MERCLPMRSRLLVMCLFLLVSAGCLDSAGPEAEESRESRVGNTDEAASGAPAAPVEDLVLDASRDVYTEVCDDQGTVVWPVMAFTETARIHFLPNETRTTLDFTWDAVNPTAARFRFEVFGGDHR